jgi:hypothetical protein
LSYREGDAKVDSDRQLRVGDRVEVKTRFGLPRGKIIEKTGWYPVTFRVRFDIPFFGGVRERDYPAEGLTALSAIERLAEL